MSIKNTIRADRAGITSAILCSVHCLIVPVLFLLKYSLGKKISIGLPVWWGYFDYLFLVISFIAVYHSAKRVKLALWFFWCVLVVAILFESVLHWMAYIASAGLIASHFWNIRQMSKHIPQPLGKEEVEY